MTVTTSRHQQSQFSSVSTEQSMPPVVTTPAGQQQRKRKSRKKQNIGSHLTSSLKASLIGGFFIGVLMLISLIPPQTDLPIPALSLALLVIPAFFVVCFSTGLLAGIFAGDSITNTQQGGTVGWMAGFWAGIYGGIFAMILAVFGAFMSDVGQRIVSQFTPEQLVGLAGWGLTPETIALIGRVFGALLIYGVIGSLIAGLVSAIGGMIYPKISNQ